MVIVQPFFTGSTAERICMKLPHKKNGNLIDIVNIIFYNPLQSSLYSGMQAKTGILPEKGDPQVGAPFEPAAMSPFPHGQRIKKEKRSKQDEYASTCSMPAGACPSACRRTGADL
ncbi:MAG TPA: hypothetical protein IAC49_04205 [Candidatus Ventricola intestinavium]|nr:hypothetical protein [Candidatus Ventricola intestinavium]